MRNQSQRNALFASLVSNNDTTITLGVLATKGLNHLADAISSAASAVVTESTVFVASCVRTQLDINKAKRAAQLRAELLMLEAE